MPTFPLFFSQKASNFLGNYFSVFNDVRLFA